MSNNIQKNNYKNKSFPPKADPCPSAGAAPLADMQRLSLIFANSNFSTPKIIFTFIVVAGIAGLVIASQTLDKSKNQLSIIQQASAQMTASYTEDFSTTNHIDTTSSTAYYNTIAQNVTLGDEGELVETGVNVGNFNAISLAGGGYVVYYNTAGNEYYFQMYDLAGIKDGSQTMVTPLGGWIEPFSATALSGGGFAFVWMDMFRDIYYAQYNSSGTLVTGPTYIANSPGSMSVGIISLNGGGYVIYWLEPDSDGQGIYARQYDSSGSPVGAAFLVNTYEIGDQENPIATELSDGGYLIGWESKNGGSDVYWFFQRFDSGGNKICFNTTAACPDDTDDLNGKEPEYFFSSNYGSAQVIQTDNNNIVVAKQDIGSIFSQANYMVFNEDGTVLISDTVAGKPFSSSSFKEVEGITGGGFVIIFEQGDEIWKHQFDSNGISIYSYPEMVNTSTQGVQNISSIVRLSGGGYVVMWRDANRSSSYFYQVYNSSGNKVGEEMAVDRTMDTTAKLARLGSFGILYVDQTATGDLYFNHLTDDAEPIVFTNGPQTVRSIRVNPYHDDIEQAIFTVNDQANGETIDYYLSNDGGATWEPFIGNPHVFADPTGDDLRWRADISSITSAVSPVIDSVTLNYTYGADRDPVTYTVCIAGPPTCDYTIIQDAVDMVPAALDNNYIIDIYTGTYTNFSLDNKQGSVDYTLTIREHSGENVILQDAATLIRGNNTRYIIIDGFNIEDGGASDCVGLSGSHNIIRNCDISNCNTVVGVGDYATIENNILHDSSSHGIQPGRYNTINNNLIYNVAGNGIELGNQPGARIYNNTILGAKVGINAYVPPDTKIYSNKIFGCSQYCVASPIAADWEVYNNILYNCEYGGMTVGLFGGTNVNVYNNTIYNNGCFGANVYNTSTIFPGTFQNNILVNNNLTPCTGGLNYNWGGAAVLTADSSYNLFYNNGLTGTGHLGGIDVNAIDMEIAGVGHAYIADPLFTDIDGIDNIFGGANGCDDDFTLQTASPGVNAGDPIFDFSNEPAPNGSRIDLGAYGGINSDYIGSSLCAISGSATASSNTTPLISGLAVSGDSEITLTFNITDAQSDLCDATTTEGSGIYYSLDNEKFFPGTILGSVGPLDSSPTGESNEVVWDAPADIAGFSGEVYVWLRVSDGSLFSEWANTSFNTSVVGTNLTGKIFIKDDLCDNYISQVTLGNNICIYQVDNALNEDMGTAETVDVTITSTAGDNETFTLTETGVDTGIFQLASIPTAKASPVLANGTIEAVKGNTITAEYEFSSAVATTGIDNFESYASTADMLHPLAGGTGNWIEAMELYYGVASTFELGTHNGYLEAYSTLDHNPVGLAVHKALGEVADLDGAMLKFDAFVEDPNGKLTSLEYPAPGSGFFLNEFLLVLVDDNPFGNPAPGSSYIELDSSVFTSSNLINWADWDNDWDEIEIAVNNTNFANFPQTPDPAELDRIERIIFVAVTGDGVGGCASIQMKLDNLSYGSPLAGYTDIDSLTGYIDTATMETNGGWDIEFGTDESFESTSTKVAFVSAGGTTNDLAVAPAYISPAPLDLDGKNLIFSIYMDNPNALHPTGFPVPPSGEYLNNFLVALVDSLGNISMYNLAPGDFTAQNWTIFSILVNNTNFTVFPSVGTPADLTDITTIEFLAITGDGSGSGNYINMAVDNLSFSTPSTTTKTIAKQLEGVYNTLWLQGYSGYPPSNLLGDTVLSIVGTERVKIDMFMPNIYNILYTDDATGDYSGDTEGVEYFKDSSLSIVDYQGYRHALTILEDLTYLEEISVNMQGFCADGATPGTIHFSVWDKNPGSWSEIGSYNGTIETTFSEALSVLFPGEPLTDYIDSTNKIHFLGMCEELDSDYLEDYFDLQMTFSQYTYSSNVSATAAGGSTCIDAIPMSPLNVTADAYPLADGTYVIRLTWDVFTGTYLYIHRDHLDASLNYIDSEIVQPNPLATLTYTDNQYIDSTGIYPGTTYTYQLRSANSCGMIDQQGTEFDITVEEQEVGVPEIIIRMGVRISQ